jgi:hypothetical protein
MTDVTPTLLVMPNGLCARGRRRSVSMSSTDLLACASAMAMLHAMVVLPSRGEALVMTKQRDGRAAFMKVRLVRMVRAHSAAADVGRWCELSSGSCISVSFGRMPTTFSPRRLHVFHRLEAAVQAQRGAR